VVSVWSAPHQQVKATTMPWSVFVIDVTWLGKISWRLSQDVQWWSNMVTSLSRTAVWAFSHHPRSPDIGVASLSVG
jgi:hypothetical protein